MAIDQETGIKLLEDRSEGGIWRVEYFDDEGGCYVTVFAGPKAEQRAREYYDALKGGKLNAITVCVQHPDARTTARGKLSDWIVLTKSTALSFLVGCNGYKIDFRTSTV